MTIRKKLTKTRTRRLLKPVGSAKTCTWIVQSKKWHDCGKPATYSAPWCGGYYCDDHAAMFAGRLVPLLPNDQAHARREPERT